MNFLKCCWISSSQWKINWRKTDFRNIFIYLKDKTFMANHPFLPGCYYITPDLSTAFRPIFLSLFQCTCFYYINHEKCWRKKFTHIFWIRIQIWTALSEIYLEINSVGSGSACVLLFLLNISLKKCKLGRLYQLNQLEGSCTRCKN